jgi:hypothetical protein
MRRLPEHLACAKLAAGFYANGEESREFGGRPGETYQIRAPRRATPPVDAIPRRAAAFGPPRAAIDVRPWVSSVMSQDSALLA